MNSQNEGTGYAVTVAFEDGHWQIRRFQDDFAYLNTSIKAVRNLGIQGAAFAMLNVENDYFVIVRPAPGGTKLLLSDATMAVDDDFAEEILSELDIDVPDIAPEELDDVDPWAEGDFDILADLGVAEEVMDVIANDPEMWPSEQLMRIAEELGCEDELSDALD